MRFLASRLDGGQGEDIAYPTQSQIPHPVTQNVTRVGRPLVVKIACPEPRETSDLHGLSALALRPATNFGHLPASQANGKLPDTKGRAQLWVVLRF